MYLNSEFFTSFEKVNIIVPIQRNITWFFRLFRWKLQFLLDLHTWIRKRSTQMQLFQPLFENCTQTGMSGNHRILKLFGLKGTIKTILFQTPDHGLGCLSLDQFAQIPSSLALNTSSDEASTTPPRNLPVPHHPQEFLPNSSSKWTLFQFKAIALVLSLQTLGKRFPAFL